MPVIDHAAVVQNLWLVVVISLGGGGLVGQVAGFVNGDLGIGARLVIGAGAALIIFGCIYFFAPATST